MYFCPCPCDDPTDHEPEEHSLVKLPRNLSYVQESYQDRYSVSARFVHNPKIERSIQYENQREREAYAQELERNLLLVGQKPDFAIPFGLNFGAPNGSLAAEKAFHEPFSSQTQPQAQTPQNFSTVATTISPQASFHTPTSFHLPSSPVTSDLVACPLSSSPSSPSSSATLGASSQLSTNSILIPAARVVSRLNVLLHSPPNESMNADRDVDLGSSVDAENLSSPPQSLPPIGQEQQMVVNPNLLLGQDMDRGFEDSVSTGDHHGHRSSDFDSENVRPGHNNVITCSISGSAGAMIDDESLSREGGSDVESVTGTDSQPEDLFPKPFGKAGKTFFPMIDCDFDLSSSEDQDESEVVEHEEEEERKEEEESVVQTEVGDTKIPERTDIRVCEMSPKIILSQYMSEGEGESKVGEENSTYTSSDLICESPDSDAFSEEGVFLNHTDDIESNHEKSTCRSDASDDTFVSEDSVFLSPEEGEFEEGRVDDSQREAPKKISLEEAISRAASDLTKMTMFEDSQAALGKWSASSADTMNCESSDSSDWTTSRMMTLATVGRGSPVRNTTGLKIRLSNDSSTENQTSLSISDSNLAESPLYEENEFNFSRKGLRKSSSLKTNKTPPNTPQRKKVVRFADAMGLDLESVRHVLNAESPPKIPASAMAYLQTGINEDRKEIGTKYLCSCFNQPGASDNFFQRVMFQKVSLENAIVTDLTITGFIRVANVSFHKSVRVRYTHNDWVTFHDIAASYVPNSCDGASDRFSFSIVAPADFVTGSKLQFAVSFSADNAEYWDNNDGQNYTFECFAKSAPTESEMAWMHFL